MHTQAAHKDPLAQTPGPDRSRVALGRYGEDIAASLLAAEGWEILDRNWRGRAGELDIIALDPDGVLVVVEVKTRSGSGFGNPAQAVTASKYGRLRRLAGQWLEEHRVRFREIRIDVMAVETGRGPARFEHIAGAFL